ncbi:MULTISPECIES: MmgE/PrpD family protein [unclassified Brenneria]|uniref:MmgE/PrpD family protein n=1 Tax=unclassified Brenneria TaxID=2634434 RepID=UPI001552835C|nr:MmgE/PrpD family protein [Brenneria sp. hezel4-2-4]MEE3652532.1 MmgE/PrpD family protein [Brenneria sp. HEZEL_4_2_4]NPD02488.1 MmgE/PrpD family protein [Brenneria sp. hezel4-2-4]
MTIARQFAHNLLEFSRQIFPAEALAHARTAIIDTLGVTLAGGIQDGAEKLRAVITPSAAAGRSRVFGTQLRLNALDAALLNGTSAHLLDFDDSNSWLHGHISVVVLPALLALADEHQSSGAQILRAYLSGYEAAVRMGKTVSPFQYRHGWHPTTSVGVFAGVAASAVLLDLTEEETATALSITASLASGIKSNFGSQTKSLAVGQANRNAVMAVLLARQGYSTGQTAFEHHHGYFNVYNQGPENYDSTPLTETWDAPSHILDPVKGNTFKAFPCCYAILSPLDALLTLREETALPADQIARIQVAIHPIRFPHINTPKPETPLAGKFSLHYCLARAWVSGQLTLDDFIDEAAFSDPLTNDLMGKVELSCHDESTTHSARVTLISRDGQHFTRHVAGAPGSSADNPLPKNLIEQKFLECASKVMTREDAQAWYQRLLQDDFD